MKYLPFALLVFSLFSCHYNELTDHCLNYMVKEPNECLKKDSKIKHISCCGLKKIYKNGDVKIECHAVGNTKASKDNFKLITQEIASKSDYTVEIECPATIDEIKGTCQEFSEISIDNQNQCFGLSVNNTEKSCCGFKADIVNPGGISATLSEIQCYELSKDAKKRQEETKKIEEEKKIPCEKMSTDCKCHGTYYMINILIYGLILLLL